MVICSHRPLILKLRRSLHLLSIKLGRTNPTHLSSYIASVNCPKPRFKCLAVSLFAALLVGAMLGPSSALALDDQSQRPSSKQLSPSSKKNSKKQPTTNTQTGKASSSNKSGSYSKTTTRKGSSSFAGDTYTKKSRGSALTLQQLDQEEPAEHSSELEEVGLDFSTGIPKLESLPRFNSRFAGRVAAITQDKHFSFKILSVLSNYFFYY